jgi:hypothetical protein
MILSDMKSSQRVTPFSGRYSLMVFLAFLVIFITALPSVLYPKPAYADQSIRIWSGQSISAIESEIQAAIDIVHAGGSGTVTVTGSNHRKTGSIHLDIPLEITVVWQADLTVDTPDDMAVIVLQGEGSFEVTDSARIESRLAESATLFSLSGYPSLKIKVSGGQIIAAASGSTALFVGSGRVSITGGEIITSESQSTAVLSTGLGVMLSGSATVRCIGSLSNGLVLNSGQLTISGGDISTESVDSVGIRSTECNLIMTGGTVKIHESGSTAILNEHGITRINQAVISAMSHSSTGIKTISGLIEVSAGTVSVSGSDSQALSSDYGSIIVSGGLVTAHQAGSRAITLSGTGCAAYLSGTTDSPVASIGRQSGAILQVSRLSTNESGHGSGDNLTLMAAGSDFDSSCSYRWDLTGEYPLIVFSYWNESVVCRITWPDLQYHPRQRSSGNENQGIDTPSTLSGQTVIMLLAVFGLSLAGVAVLIIWRRLLIRT